MSNIIGKGAHRIVYAHELGVIKKARKASTKVRNLYESEIWQLAKGTEYERWLVPVVDCHKNGDWLIMEKAEGIDEKVQYQRQSWMQDTKWKNWGIHNGEVKLLDYGNKTILQNLKRLI